MTSLFNFPIGHTFSKCIERFKKNMEPYCSIIEKESTDFLYTYDILSVKNNTAIISNNVTKETYCVDIKFLGYYNINTQIYTWQNYVTYNEVLNYFKESKIFEIIYSGAFICPIIFSKNIEVDPYSHNIIPAFIRLLYDTHRLYTISEQNKIRYILIDCPKMKKYFEPQCFHDDINDFEYYCEYIFRQDDFEEERLPLQELTNIEY